MAHRARRPTGKDGAWLGAADIRLTPADMADTLATATGTVLRTWRPSHRAARMAAAAGLAVAAGTALATLPPNTAAGVLSLCGLAMLVVAGLPHGLLRTIMLPAAWMTLRQNPALAEGASVAWRRTGLYAAGQGSAAVTPWSDIGGWAEGRAFVLHKPGAGYITIPKHLLQDREQASLRAAIEAAGIPRLGTPDTRATPPAPTLPDLPPPGPRRVTYQLTRHDLTSAHRLLVLRAVRQPATVWMAAVLAALAWWFAWPALPGPPLLSALATGVTATLLLRLALPWAVTPWDVRRGLRHGTGAPVQLTWDADGFTGTYATGDIRKPWTEVRRWHQTRTLVFLSLGPRFGQTIPLRALTPAQQTDIRACAATAGVGNA